MIITAKYPFYKTLLGLSIKTANKVRFRTLSMENCQDLYQPWVTFQGPYLEFALGIPAFISLQLLLLFHSIHHEFVHRENEVYQQVSIKSRILYIILQFLGLYWTTNDLFCLVIDPQTHLLRDNIGCDIMAYSPKIIPWPYYLVYLYQVLLRLDSSLKGSYLELSKKTLYFLNAITVIPVIIAPIIFFILNRSERTCIAPWKPNDFHYDNFSNCWLPLQQNSIALLVYTAVLVWIPIINIIIGIIFGVKLNKLLSSHKDNDHIKFQFKSLIVKNGILTLTGSVSTIVNYLLWSSFIRATFLYLDLFINCLVIGLMFKYNEKWYKKLCKCWIILCFANCDKSKRKLKDTQIMGYVNDEIDLSSILNMSSVDRNGEDIPEEVISSIGDMVSDVDGHAHHENVVSGSDDEDDIIPYASTAGATTTPEMKPVDDPTVTVVEMKIHNK